MNLKSYILLILFMLCSLLQAQPELTNTEATNIDTEAERNAWKAALDSIGEIKSGNFTASNQVAYIMVATGTVTDPTPAEGEGFTVFVRNGTATVGGTAYATAGTMIRRTYHSGAWSNEVNTPDDAVAITGGTISGVSSIGSTGNITASAANSLIKASSSSGEITMGSANSFGNHAALWFAEPNGVVAAYTLAAGNTQIYKDSTDLTFNVPTGDGIEFMRNGSMIFELNSGSDSLYIPSGTLQVGSGTWSGSIFSGSQSFTGTVGVTGALSANGGLNIPTGQASYTASPFSFGISSAFSPTGTGATFYNTSYGAATIARNPTGGATGLFYLPDIATAGTDIVVSAGAQTLDSKTLTNVPSASITGDLTVDTTTLYVDSANNVVGLGTSTPDSGVPIHIVTTSGSAFRIERSTVPYWEFQTSASGGFAFRNETYGLDSFTLNNAGAFFAGGNASGATPSLSVLASGFTGLRQKNPTTTLEIGTGSISFSTNSGTWSGSLFGGDQAFSGQVTMTGQAASSDNAAMTRILVHKEGKDTYTKTWTNFSGTGTVSGTTGTGLVQSDYNALQIQSGNTAGGEAYQILGSYINMSPGVTRANVDFDRAIVMEVEGQNVYTGSDGEARILWPVNSTWTGGDLTKEGFGFKIIANTIYGQVYQGGAVTNTTSTATVASLTTMKLQAICDGGSVSFYCNGVLIETLTAPSGTVTGYSNIGLGAHVKAISSSANQYVIANRIELRSY